MSKIWFFGDSYVSFKTNWVQELANRCNAEVAHLGVAGSSIYFLLLDLLDNYNTIDSHDKVVIAITSDSRWYFNKVHFMPHKDSEEWILNQSYSSEDMLNAFQYFTKYLYNVGDNVKFTSAIVSFILNVLLPKISTKQIVYHYTISPFPFQPKNNDFNVQTREYEPISFYEFQIKFLRKYYPEVDNPMEVLNRYKNHWLEHPEYFGEWWETYDLLFKKLYYEK